MFFVGCWFSEFNWCILGFCDHCSRRRAGVSDVIVSFARFKMQCLWFFESWGASGKKLLTLRVHGTRFTDGKAIDLFGLSVFGERFRVFRYELVGEGSRLSKAWLLHASSLCLHWKMSLCLICRQTSSGGMILDVVFVGTASLRGTGNSTP